MIRMLVHYSKRALFYVLSKIIFLFKQIIF